MKKVSSLTTVLLKKVRQTPEFRAAGLVNDWHLIVGADMARFCQVEKVQFPSQGSGASSSVAANGKGKIYIQAISSMAPHLAFHEPQLLEKINNYLGYQAIEKIIINHKGMGQKPSNNKTSTLSKIYSNSQDFQEAEPPILKRPEILKDIKDEKIYSALNRLNKMLINE